MAEGNISVMSKDLRKFGLSEAQKGEWG